MATEERLAPFRPLAKFLCVKAIIFFSYWQSCAFTIILKLQLISKDTANISSQLIISVEMVFCSIAQAIAFDYKPFIESNKIFRGNMLKNIGNVLNVKDVIHDAHNTFIKDESKDSE